MKMSKQVKTMVTSVNEYLKDNHIKNQGDPQFVLMTHLLLKANCYQGFNYFTANDTLAGGDNEKFDHLQFYIM